MILFRATLLLTVFVASQYAQTPAQNPPATKPKPRTPGAKRAKPAAAAVKEAPKSRVLSLPEAAELLTKSEALDEDCARLVNAATMPLPPEEDWVQGLMKIRARKERPACYEALLKKVPEGPSLAEVEQQAPAMLEQVRGLVQAGKRDELQPLLRPEFLSTDTSGLPLSGNMYPQTGGFFSLFDVGRYQKHQLGRFMPVPGRKIGVPVYVLTTDVVENFFFVVFTKYQGKLVFRSVLTGREIAEFALNTEKEWAVQKLRDLFRDLNQGSESTAKAISTNALLADTQKIGGWKRVKRDQRLDVESIAIAPSVPLNQKSVRVVTRVSFPVQGGQMLFDVDFERMGAELRAVRLRDKDGRDIAYDKEMDCYIVKRYGLTSACTEYKATSTDNPWFIEKSRLIDYARRAVEGSKPDEIEQYAKELTTSFDTDDVRGLPQGLQATALFLRGDYKRFYETGSQAIERNGEVYIPLARLYAADVVTGSPLRPMILGLSGAGLRYIPSYQDVGRTEALITTANLKEVKFGGNRPVIEVELRGLPEKNWKLFLPGSTCATPTNFAALQPAGRSALIPFEGGRILADNPCNIVKMPVIRIPGGKKDPNAPTLYVPGNWPEMVRSLTDLYQSAAKQMAKATPK